MVDDVIHDHVEDRGGQGLSLSNSVVSLEKRSIITSVPVHHGEPASVSLGGSKRHGAYHVRRKNIEASVPIQGIFSPSFFLFLKFSLSSIFFTVLNSAQLNQTELI